jgi:hypothetical protein
MAGHAAQDATEADQQDAIRMSMLLGALWAPKDTAKQVTAWLQSHGLAQETSDRPQDPTQVWLATDRYWMLAEMETAADG